MSFLLGLLHHCKMTQIRGVDGQSNWVLTLQMDDFYVSSCLRGKHIFKVVGQNLGNRNTHPIKNTRRCKEIMVANDSVKRKQAGYMHKTLNPLYSLLLTLLKWWKPPWSHSRLSHLPSCLNVPHVPCCKGKSHNQENWKHFWILEEEKILMFHSL